jgi:hypothetical protein
MTEQTRPLEKPESSGTLVLQPRVVRFKDAPRSENFWLNTESIQIGYGLNGRFFR